MLDHTISVFDLAENGMFLDENGNNPFCVLQLTFLITFAPYCCLTQPQSLQIVDKALEEPKYSSLYAQLCLRLAEDAPNFDGPSAESHPGQKQSTVSASLSLEW